MARGDQKSWIPLAKEFPAGLATFQPDSQIAENQSADAYGMDPDTEGLLKSGTAPSATTRIAKTYTIDSVVYNWWYDRLWRISGTQLIYGAPHYTASYIEQGISHLDFTEDANSLIVAVPCGQEGAKKLAVIKSTGGYLVQNANDSLGRFDVGDIIQELHVSTATHVTELDGILYFSNASGLFALNPQNGEITEITLAVRNSITNFAAKPLEVNHEKKMIIGDGGNFVYDTRNAKLFDYTTSGFRYTSRNLIQQGRSSEEPFTVFDMDIRFERGSTADASLTYQTRLDDNVWNPAVDVQIRESLGHYQRAHIPLDTVKTSRSFQVRLTALSSNIHIREIWVHAEGFTIESLSASE